MSFMTPKPTPPALAAASLVFRRISLVSDGRKVVVALICEAVSGRFHLLKKTSIDEKLGVGVSP